MHKERIATTPSQIRAVLFDKDGTLIDFDRSWAAVNRKACLLAAAGNADLARRLCTECGMDFETGRTRGGSLFAAGNAREIAEGMIASGSRVPPEKLVTDLDLLFQEGADEAVAITDLPVLFASLRSLGIKLGIASSDNEGSIRRCLVAHGVDATDVFIAGYDSGHGVKPGPGMVIAFSKTSGIPPAGILVVGDNTHDLEMGHAAGAGLVVGVLSGTGIREELAPRADRLFQSVAELPPFLRSRHTG